MPNVWIRPLANSSAALVSIGALVIAAPIADPRDSVTKAAAAYELISYDDRYDDDNDRDDDNDDNGRDDDDRNEWVNGVYVGDTDDTSGSHVEETHTEGTHTDGTDT